MGGISSIPISFGVWLVFLYVIARVAQFSLRSLPGKHYPPGPRCLPFIGNVHHLSDKPFLQFAELGKKYGEIVGLKSGPGNIVVLNSISLVRELLEKRGGKYSGRPCGYVPREHIVHDSKHVMYLPNDSYLQQWRGAARYILGSGAVKTVLPIQEAAAADLMLKLAKNPGAFLEQFRVWALVVPLHTICGDRTARNNPDLQNWFFNYQHTWLELLTPGLAPPVDMFPIMKYVPESLSGWKRTAKFLRKNMFGFYYMLLDKAKKELTEKSEFDNATAEQQRYEPLMTKILREQQEGKEVFSTDELANLGGGLLDAAIDTTYSTSLVFVMILAAYPDIQKRVLAEVDGLRGTDHPPRGEDIGKLPFLKACHLEILRWRPVVPSSLPHLLDADDTIGGYHLKKGTIILQNTWGINQDPANYENPEVFDPDRYLTNPYGTKMSADEAKASGRKPVYIFGVGRRRCPGDVFAENSVLVTMAKLVWAFNVIPTGPIDTSVETGFHSGMVIGPENLKVEFVPRSEKHRQALFDDFQRLSHVLE